MITPLATVADALIEFILSLLRDPSAQREFDRDPEGMLERAGLSGICSDDVKAVKPVVVDHPSVSPKPVQPNPNPNPNPGPPNPPGPPVVKEIKEITQTFHLDNRSTIIDQSVNQNIWAEGDVTQHFDQSAVVASGDNSVAAGNDAAVDNSKTDTTIGDVNIGNDDIDVTIDGSYNDNSTDSDITADIDGSLNDNSTNTDTDIGVDIDDSFQHTVDVDTDVAVDIEVTDSDVYNSSAALEVDVPVEVQFDQP